MTTGGMLHYYFIKSHCMVASFNGLGVTSPHQDQLSGDQLVNWSVCRMSLSGGKLRVELISGDLARIGLMGGSCYNVQCITCNSIQNFL